MATHYWLVKSEPSTFSWERFLKEKGARWDGVRNFEARNNLRAMKKGDQALFYHSTTGKVIVGIARVAKEAYPDPTAKGEDWSAVDLVPVAALPHPVSLARIKADPILGQMALVRRSRISVVPVTAEEFARVRALSQAPG
jgi:predicted RNA-binding protein with PUA-like domain